MLAETILSLKSINNIHSFKMIIILIASCYF
uniref:Uncharacterized protein n=1 Tax=Anguilla anguilla TaxID=7936 RepID=A0A0E9T269_ANGAN